MTERDRERQREREREREGERERPLGSTRRRWDDNIKMDLKTVA